jgi:hypothetical protein
MMTKFKNFIKDQWDRTRKWFKYLFVVPVALAAGIAGQQPEIPKTIDKVTIQQKYQDATLLKEKYINEGSSFRQVVKPDWKEKTEVRIGEETATEFKPTFELRKWDETRIKLTPKLETVASKDKSVDFVGEDIKYKNGNKEEISFENLFVSAENPEGGYEINWILNEKPKTNVVEFNIETEGLNFFYQPELTQEEKDQGAESPENVVGSYAVYASEQKTNWEGGKLYRTGKVGHIFRPKIIDSAGTEVWGDLRIENGILSVTIPQEFLDNAVYPIRHAAGLEFGYHAAGSSYVALTGYTNLASSKYTLSEAASVSSVTISAQHTPVGSSLTKMGIYDDDGGSGEPSSLLGTSAAVTVGTTKTYYSGNLSLSLSVGDFYLAVTNQSGIRLYYDSSGDSREKSDPEGDYYTTLPNPFPSSPTSGTKKICIYATYTASGGATPAQWIINIDE